MLDGQTSAVNPYSDGAEILALYSLGLNICHVIRNLPEGFNDTIVVGVMLKHLLAKHWEVWLQRILIVNASTASMAAGGC